MTKRQDGPNLVLVAKWWLSQSDFPLRFYRGDFYRWTGTHYHQIEERLIQSEVQQAASREDLDLSPRDISEVMEAVKNETVIVGDHNPPFQIGEKC